ncbi:MAG: hypothetical protein ACK4GO_15735 [Gemmobacter sp.]
MIASAAGRVIPPLLGSWDGLSADPPVTSARVPGTLCAVLCAAATITPRLCRRSDPTGANRVARYHARHGR